MNIAAVLRRMKHSVYHGNYVIDSKERKEKSEYINQSYESLVKLMVTVQLFCIFNEI